VGRGWGDPNVLDCYKQRDCGRKACRRWEFQGESGSFRAMSDVVDGRVSDPLQQRVESLFGAHVEAVFNVAYRVLWNRFDAEDVVQATFLKALARLDQLDDSSRVRPWLLQVAYRESISVIRRRRDVPVDPADVPELVCPDRGPADLAVLSDLAAALSRALGRLDADERIAVVLRDVEQLPMREVAAVLGVGVSAAKMRVHRGRQSLRRLMEASEVLS